MSSSDTHPSSLITVLYSCPFVPAEWVAAHGLRPSRVIPAAAGSAGATTGLCPYAQSFVRHVCNDEEAGAVVLTTTCDQMRRASESIVRSTNLPLFLFHVPATWQTMGSQNLYLAELKRLGRFLQQRGGEAPTSKQLAEVIDGFDKTRSRLKDARGRLSPRRFSEAIAEFHRTGEFTDDGAAPAESGLSGVPIALVGGPLLADHFDLFDRIEAAGGRVVLDATTTGERTLPGPFDRRRLRDDPLATLADAYFGSIADAFRRPNTALYTWLREKIAERGVRGIIYRSYVWCDTWHAEAQRLKEWADAPVLTIVSDDEAGTIGHAASRIESFLEMLK